MLQRLTDLLLSSSMWVALQWSYSSSLYSLPYGLISVYHLDEAIHRLWCCAKAPKGSCEHPIKADISHFDHPQSHGAYTADRNREFVTCCGREISSRLPRPRCCTVEHIMAIKDLAQQGRAERVKTFACFIDLQAAKQFRTPDSHGLPGCPVPTALWPQSPLLFRSHVQATSVLCESWCRYDKRNVKRVPV